MKQMEHTHACIQEDKHKKSINMLISRSNQSACSLARTFRVCDKKGARVVHPATWSMNSLPKSPSPICSHATTHTCYSHATNYSQYAPQFSTPRNQVESFENNNCSTCFSDIDEWLEHANNFCIPSNFQTNHLTGTVDSRRNGRVDEDLRISAVCNTFLMVPEDELYNITLPSVREESPIFQGQTRLTCIYGATKFGSNECRRLIRRLTPHDEFLEEIRRKKQEAKRDARKKIKHAELMHRMRRKEDAIDDWELQQTRKAMDEMDKLQNELERKQLMASARTQKKICLVREKAEKQKLHLRLSTMQRFQKLQI